MEASNEERRESYTNKTGELEEHRDALQEKMAKLAKTKEELTRAKDSAMQSWLDSKPLIDELEKLQSDLASAKNRTSMSNIVILELESQLEAANMSIRSKMEEDFKATKMTNEITRVLELTREELETIKTDADEERRERSKLKQVLRMRRQTLRTLQLTIRATRIQSEALGASAAETIGHINRSETDNTTVHVTQEEYYALTRKAKEETSLAEWRISVSNEQKLAAEASRDLALSRLKGLQSEKRPRRRRMKEEKIIEERQRIKQAGEQINNGIAFPKARAKEISKSNGRNPPKQMRRSASSSNIKLVKEKKPTIISRMRRYFARSITRLFG